MQQDAAKARPRTRASHGRVRRQQPCLRSDHWFTGILPGGSLWFGSATSFTGGRANESRTRGGVHAAWQVEALHASGVSPRKASK